MKIKVHHFPGLILDSKSLTISKLKAATIAPSDATLWLQFNRKHKLYKTNLELSQVEIILSPDSGVLSLCRGDSTILEY